MKINLAHCFIFSRKIPEIPFQLLHYSEYDLLLSPMIFKIQKNKQELQI